MSEEPQPVTDLICLHVNEEAVDMGAPSWAQHKAVYRLGEVWPWAEENDSWTVLSAGSFEIGTQYGDLPVYKLILK